MIASFKPYPLMKDSGVEWLGAVPEHWEVRKLRRMLRSMTERNRPDLPLLSVVREQGVVLRDISNQDENHNFIPDDLTNYKVVQRGHFAMNKMKAWQGSYGVSRFDGIVSPAYFVFSLDGVNGDYFHTAIRSKIYVPYFTRASDGVRIGQWDLSLERMREIPFSLPPLPEQAAIVRFIDHADRRIRRYIRAKQKLIKLLEEQKQALIHEAVTGRIDVRTGQPYPAYKPSGIEWMEEVPEHWEIRRIASFSPKITNGWVGPTRDILTESGVPYIQSLHIKQGQIQFIKKYFVSSYWLRGHDKAQLRHGDVIVVQTGDIGQVACVPPNFDGAGCHALIIIRTDPDVMSGRFLDLLLRSNYGYNSLLRMQTGALHPHLNCTWVREIFLPVPPLAEQISIVRYLDKTTAYIDTAIVRARSQVDLLKEYRTRLIADVVTGKLDVREAAAGLPEVDSLANEFDALTTQATETGMMAQEDATELSEELAMENEVII